MPHGIRCGQDEEDGLVLKDGYKDRKKYIVIIGFTPEGIAIGVLLLNSEITSFKRSELEASCSGRYMNYLLPLHGVIVFN